MKPEIVQPCLRCQFASDPEPTIARRCQNVFSDHYSRPIEGIATCAEFVPASGRTEANTNET